MTDRTAWDDRIPRPNTLTELSDEEFLSQIETAALAESAVETTVSQTNGLAPGPRRTLMTRTRSAMAATLVVGICAGLTAAYAMWVQPQQRHIDRLQTAVADAGAGADQLKALGDDNALLAERLAAASGDATACRKAAQAAQDLDEQWRAWAAEFDKFANVVTEAQALKLASRLQARYDKIVRQEGRVDTLAEACFERATTAQV